MYKVFTGLCCGLWCLFLALNILEHMPGEKDMFDAAAVFAQQMESPVRSTFYLSGSITDDTAAGDIPLFLEEAAGVLKIDNGFAVTASVNDNGCIWELAGADAQKSYSFKYFRNSCSDSFISWKLQTGTEENLLKDMYGNMNLLREKYNIEGMVTMELAAVMEKSADSEEMKSFADAFLKNNGIREIYSAGEGNLYICAGYRKNLGRNVLYNGEPANVNLICRAGEDRTGYILGFPAVQKDG